MTNYMAIHAQKLLLSRESVFLGTFDDGKEALVSDRLWRFALVDRITGFPRNLKVKFTPATKEESWLRTTSFAFTEFRAGDKDSGYLIGSVSTPIIRYSDDYWHDAKLFWVEIDVHLRTIHIKELVNVVEMEKMKQFFILSGPDSKSRILSCSDKWMIHGNGEPSETIEFIDEPVNVEDFQWFDEAEDAGNAEDVENVEDAENIEEVEEVGIAEEDQEDEEIEDAQPSWRRFVPTTLEEGDQAFVAAMGKADTEVEPNVLQLLVVRSDGTKTCGVIDVPENLRGKPIYPVDGTYRNHIFVVVNKDTPEEHRMSTYAINLMTLAWRLAVPDFKKAGVPILQFNELHFRVGNSEIWSYKLGEVQSLRLLAASVCNMNTWSRWEHKVFAARGEYVPSEYEWECAKKKQLVSRQRAFHYGLRYPKNEKRYVREYKAWMDKLKSTFFKMS